MKYFITAGLILATCGFTREMEIWSQYDTVWIGATGVPLDTTEDFDTTRRFWGVPGRRWPTYARFVDADSIVRCSTGTDYAILGKANNYGVYGLAITDYGVYGRANGSYGVRGLAMASFGVYGDAVGQYGVYGKASMNYGVYGETDLDYGVKGEAAQDYGVYGDAVGDYGVYGIAGGDYGVYGIASSYGVYGGSYGNYGVYGAADSSYGVYGTANNSYGVYGLAIVDYGVYGDAENDYGVYGTADSSYGVYGTARYGDYGVYGTARYGNYGGFFEAANYALACSTPGNTDTSLWVKRGVAVFEDHVLIRGNLHVDTVKPYTSDDITIIPTASGGGGKFSLVADYIAIGNGGVRSTGRYGINIGGLTNICSGQWGATVAGRYNDNTQYYSVISGGRYCDCGGQFCGMSGGEHNAIVRGGSPFSPYCIISGGKYDTTNHAYGAGIYSSYMSKISDVRWSSIYGGYMGIVQGDTLDSCNVLIGGGVMDGTSHSVLIADGLEDTLDTDNTFAVMHDSAVMPPTRFTGDVIPTDSGTQNFGSPSKKWARVYTDSLKGCDGVAVADLVALVKANEVAVSQGKVILDLEKQLDKANKKSTTAGGAAGLAILLQALALAGHKKKRRNHVKD